MLNLHCQSRVLSCKNTELDPFKL